MQPSSDLFTLRPFISNVLLSVACWQLIYIGTAISDMSAFCDEVSSNHIATVDTCQLLSLLLLAHMSSLSRSFRYNYCKFLWCC